MSTAIKKITDNIFEIDGFRIYRGTKMWVHAKHRIDEFKKLPHDSFMKKMYTRLKRTTHKDKLYYTIAVLYDMGEEDLADLYDAKIVAELLSDL